MKKIIMILMVAIGVSSIAFGQTKMSKDTKVEAQVIALEKQSWEAIKTKDVKFLDALLTDDAIAVSGDGVANKAQWLKSTFADGCALKSYSTQDFKVVMFDKNTAMVTYKATQDSACNGKQDPANIWLSSLYVKRGGKWLNSFFQITPINQ